MTKTLIVNISIIALSLFLISSFTQAGPEDYDDPPELISLDLKDMDIKDVFKLLSQKSGLNIIADKDVEGSLTLYLKDVEVMQALDIIVSTNDLAYEQKGTLIRVMPREKYQRLYAEEPKDAASKDTTKDTAAHISTKLEDFISSEHPSTIVVIEKLENIEKVFLTPPGPQAEKSEKTPQTLKAETKEEIAVEKKVEKIKKKKAESKAKPEVKKPKKALWARLFGTPEAKEVKSVTKYTPYEDYSFSITQQINTLAKTQDVGALKGEVNLQFTLDKEGFLIRGPVVLNKPDLKLVRAAVRCVKEISPFPAFPNQIKEEEKEFNVVVRYE